MKLPNNHRPYIDKYFLRAKEILIKEGLNPTIKAQVFIRKGDAYLYGIDEAVEIIKKYGDHDELVINALKEEDYFDNCETIMTIEGRAQSLIDLETMYLGVISAETTKKNDGIFIEPHDVTKRMKRIVDLVSPRPVSYFGARHWRYDEDERISTCAFLGGASVCSTDIGASTAGQEGVGTIPHALEAIYHEIYGLENAVVEATKAFNNHIDPRVPRIALVDYANREIDDSLACARELGNSLDGIRIDTCGENTMQGTLERRGVSIEGVHLIRKALNNNGFSDVKIILSSGFGNPDKVKKFIDFEKNIDMKIFDSLGVGGIFEARMTTTDIIEVNGKPISKAGRTYKPNPRLMRR